MLRRARRAARSRATDAIGDRADRRRSRSTALGAGAGLTIVVGLPKGAIQPDAEADPRKRRTLDDAFAVTADTLGLAGRLAVLGIGAVVVLAYRARPRPALSTGSAVDAAMGNVTGRGSSRSRCAPRDAGPVEFVPPDRVRPGQVGTLIDEQANLLDVTATIVDLAVRGCLTITELDRGLERQPRLRARARLDKREGHELLPYEQQLLDALFATGPRREAVRPQVQVPSELAEIQNALYDDVVTQGWYRVRPDRTRPMLATASASSSSSSASALTFLVAATTIVRARAARDRAHRDRAARVAGTCRRAPARAARCSPRVRGFRRLFDEGEEDIRPRFAEQHEIFSQYLPYAIVFGCTEKWAKAFEGSTPSSSARRVGTPAPTVRRVRARVRDGRLRHRARPARCTRASRRRRAAAASAAASPVVAAAGAAAAAGKRRSRAKLPPMTAPTTIAELFRAHVGNDRSRVCGSKTRRGRTAKCSTRSRPAPRSCSDRKPADAPFHVGVLFDNTPEIWFALRACAVSGATLVGINPTRRGSELARDVEHTDCTCPVDRAHPSRAVGGRGRGRAARPAVRRRLPRVDRRDRAVPRAPPCRRSRSRRPTGSC